MAIVALNVDSTKHPPVILISFITLLAIVVTEHSKHSLWNNLYLIFLYYRVLRDGDIVNVDVSVYYKVRNIIFYLAPHKLYYIYILLFPWISLSIIKMTSSSLSHEQLQNNSKPCSLSSCQGYHGDLNETFFVGKIDKKSQDLVECAYRSLAAAIAIVKPGALYRFVLSFIDSLYYAW